VREREGLSHRGEEGGGGEGEKGLATEDHLENLKALTEKLKLETRRPSYLEWKARIEAESFRESRSGKGPIQVEPEGKVIGKSDGIQCKLPSGVLKGFENIDEALSWLRRELVRHRIVYNVQMYPLSLKYGAISFESLVFDASLWPYLKNLV